MKKITLFAMMALGMLTYKADAQLQTGENVAVTSTDLG